MSLRKPKLIFLLFTFIGAGAFSQNNSQQKIFETYDAIVGLDNTGLFNGTEFTDLFLNTDGTFRYFNGFDYSKGSVKYNGQFYPNVSLKYDLLEDNLLTRSDDNLSIFDVKLIPQFVESFSIYGKTFVRLHNTNLPDANDGFFEEGFLGNEMSLYTRHTKKKKDRASKRGVQYRFLDDNYYVLKVNEKYHVVRKAKDVWKLLPEREQQIREFSKTYKALSKSDPRSFMVKLVDHIDGLGQNTDQ